MLLSELRDMLNDYLDSNGDYTVYILDEMEGEVFLHTNITLDPREDDEGNEFYILNYD